MQLIQNLAYLLYNGAYKHWKTPFKGAEKQKKVKNFANVLIL